jgi:hypothetical protein
VLQGIFWYFFIGILGEKNEQAAQGTSHPAIIIAYRCCSECTQQETSIKKAQHG